MLRRAGARLPHRPPRAAEARESVAPRKLPCDDWGRLPGGARTGSDCSKGDWAWRMRAVLAAVVGRGRLSAWPAPPDSVPRPPLRSVAAPLLRNAGAAPDDTLPAVLSSCGGSTIQHADGNLYVWPTSVAAW